MTGYTTNQVAELVGLKPEQVRAYVETGLLSAADGHIPHHHYRYSFQDIVLLRMAKQLSAARAGPKSIARALNNLKRRLPAGKPLSSVRVLVHGSEVLVQEQDALWHPETGQIELDFSMAVLTQEVEPMVKAAARSASLGSGFSPDEWYNLGIDLEMVGDLDEAERLYRRTVAQDPAHADAWVNLGRLAHVSGDSNEAVTLFRRALDIQPDHALAWFNLGVVYETRDERENAESAYRRALSLDPEFADAHYNLSRLCEQSGDRQAALRHLTAYRRSCGR